MTAKTPDWQTRAIREIQWRTLWSWCLSFVVTVGLIAVMEWLGWKELPWFLAAVLPMMVVFGSLTAAYKRGVADGRAHPESSDTKNRDNPTI
jgi:uncharacterized membrane protein YdbT with pleckstrin-like domain